MELVKRQSGKCSVTFLMMNMKSNSWNCSKPRSKQRGSSSQTSNAIDLAFDFTLFLCLGSWDKSDMLKMLYTGAFSIPKTISGIEAHQEWLSNPKFSVMEPHLTRYIDEQYFFTIGRDKQFRPILYVNLYKCAILKDVSDFLPFKIIKNQPLRTQSTFCCFKFVDLLNRLNLIEFSIIENSTKWKSV